MMALAEKTQRRRRGVVGRLAAGALLTAACAVAPSAPADDPPTGTIRLYTSVTQETVDAVLAAFVEERPEINVEVFRAPTGELDARIAAELREGSVRGDVFWGTDPPSARRHAEEGLFRRWSAPELEHVPPEYRSELFVGTRILNMVIVARPDLAPAPATWHELADASIVDRVAIPDPGFAGSALGALGFFGLAQGFGMDYYRTLRDNGAVQVQSPGDVVTGVAERRYQAGMTLDNIARGAVEAGSPIELIWPEPGAVAMFSPIAVFEASTNPAAAESFAAFVLSRAGQEAIAATGWQPVREDIAWPHRGPVVRPDWERVFEEADRLLEEYRAIFGG